MVSRFRIIMIIIAGLAIIITAVFLIFYWHRQTPISPPVADNSNQSLPSKSVAAPLPPLNQNLNQTPPPSLSQEDKIKIDLKQLARAFTERFGSYSNQSRGKNIEDLYDFMTPQMRRWAESLVNQIHSQQSQSPPLYSGTTTKVLSAEVTEFDLNNQRATVKVKTQRREAVGSSVNARVYYQDILIKLSQIQGVWKVAGAYWQ